MLPLGQSTHQFKSSHLNLLVTCLLFSFLSDKKMPGFLDYTRFKIFIFFFSPSPFVYSQRQHFGCSMCSSWQPLISPLWNCLVGLNVNANIYNQLWKVLALPFRLSIFLLCVENCRQLILKRQWYPDFSDIALAFYPFSVSQWFTLLK